jgi:endonuclease YncB( thermonuclease family)
MEWRRATVVGVLSGDTICVKYADLGSPYGIIKIAGGQAPNLSFYTSYGLDEPYGIEAWKQLRQLLKTKTVFVAFPPISTSPELLKIPLLGELPVITTDVKTSHDGEDVLSYLLANGCAKCIDETDQKRASLIKAAKTKALGLWSASKLQQCQQCQPPDIKKIYSEETEFSAFLIDFDSNCIATLFIPTNVTIIELEVSGIFIPSVPKELKTEISRFLADFLLFSNLRVRIQQINKKNMLVGVITSNGHDLASILLKKGYAITNDVTISLRTDSNNLLIYEKRANQRKYGLWQIYPPMHNIPIPKEFEGIVIEIVSTSILSIRPKNATKEIKVTLNGIKVPEFRIHAVSEPGGYEAYEYLRKHVGSSVRVEINDQISDVNYGIVYTRFNDGSENCVNEWLIKNNMATLCTSGVISMPTKNVKYLEQASIAARTQSNAPTQPKLAITFRIPSELELLDLVRGSNPNKKKHGIISAVYSPMCFLIDIPDSMIRIPFCLKDIEALSPEEYISEVAVDFLRTNYLNREVSFIIGNTDLSNGNVCGTFSFSDSTPDIRIELLKNGYVRLLRDEALRKFEKQAKDAKKGAWERSKRLFPISPQPPAVVLVRVTTIIDPLTVAVQTKTNSHDSFRFESLDLMLNPKPGALVVFVRNNFAYRAIVKRVDGQVAYIHLIDQGYYSYAFVEELRRITDDLSRSTAKGMSMKLAFISLFHGSEDYVVKYLHNILGNRAPLYAHVVGTTSAPEVILTVDADPNSMSVQYLMVRDGAVKPAKERPSSPLFQEFYDRLIEGEKFAKTAELGFYGRKN